MRSCGLRHYDSRSAATSRNWLAVTVVVARPVNVIPKQGRRAYATMNLAVAGANEKLPIVIGMSNVSYAVAGAGKLRLADTLAFRIILTHLPSSECVLSFHFLPFDGAIGFVRALDALPLGLAEVRPVGARDRDG